MKLYLAAAALAVAIAVGFARARAGTPAAMRIVSLGPSVTETLFALGSGGEVVGVSRYCDYPPAALKLPRIGDWLTPNLEAIVALRPTLVIGPALSSNSRDMRVLESIGCPVVSVQDDSLRDIQNSILAIGARIGRGPEARALNAQVDSEIAAVRERIRTDRPVRVVMLVGHAPIVAVGPNTYLDDLLKLAGGQNIADAATDLQWPQLSVEYIVAMRPDVILDGQMGNDSSSPSHYWEKFTTIPAVRNHRVVGYPQDPVLHPGPRVGQSLAILAALIHPDAVGTANAEIAR